MIYNSSKKNVAAVKYMDNTWRASNNKEIIHLYSYLKFGYAVHAKHYTFNTDTLAA